MLEKQAKGINKSFNWEHRIRSKCLFSLKMLLNLTEQITKNKRPKQKQVIEGMMQYPDKLFQ